MAASSYPGTIELSDIPPRRSATTLRPPGGVFRLEDRLPGVLGSIAPPPTYALRAFEPAAAPPRSNRAFWLALALVAISGLTVAVVYRDMTRPPVTLSPSPP